MKLIHGNMQSITPLRLCFERPRDGGGGSTVKTFTEVKYFDGYTSRRVVFMKQAHHWESDNKRAKDQQKDLIGAFNVRPKHKRLNKNSATQQTHRVTVSLQTINCKIFCAP